MTTETTVHPIQDADTDEAVYTVLVHRPDGRTVLGGCFPSLETADIFRDAVRAEDNRRAFSQLTRFYLHPRSRPEA